MSRRWTKQQESRLGRRGPKRLPTKYLRIGVLHIDWPFGGPRPGRSMREFVKIARRREARAAWKREEQS